MARKASSKTYKSSASDSTPFGVATLDENGVAPDCVVSNCNDAYSIFIQLLRDNTSRDNRNSRIYKCYKMFAPTDYSEIMRKQMQGMSNTPFGQMRSRVNKRKGTFFDMISQRTLAAQITTKHGNPMERKIWSDAISIGFNQLLKDWKSYNTNVNMDIEEMSLYGKGFEISECMDGWPTRSYHNSSILVPDYTFSDLSNLDMFAIKRSYTPIELWKKIGRGDKEHAEAAGWNFRAVVDAMRCLTGSSNRTFLRSQAEWLRQVASGSFNLNRYYNKRINVFELIVQEYDRSISKMIGLQNYGPLLGAYNEGKSASNEYTEEQYRDGFGFLYFKKNWVSAEDFKTNGWSEVINPITDIPGSGLWHEIQGFAEGIFSQCRYYDLHMNRVMDGMDMNMRLLLEGGSAEGTKKLKQMDWTAPFMVLPEDVKPAQHRFDVPVERAIGVMQYYMGETDRETAQNQPISRASDQTATAAQLNAAENAKIQGTELSQFNICQTEWMRALYRRLDRTKKGGEGYELKEKFEDYMAECKVPKEAYAYKNIQSINSMMLSGAGNPAYQLTLGEKAIWLTSITPANEGQELAIRNTLAGLFGPEMAEAYRPAKKSNIGDQYRVIANENLGFYTPFANPESLQVEPEDHHIEHLQGHFSDLNLKTMAAEQLMQQGQIEQIKPMLSGFQLEGAHIVAHIQFVAKDPTKEKEAKAFSQQLNEFQKKVDAITSAVTQAAQAQQPQQMSKEEQDIQFIVAKQGLELDQKQKLAEQKRGERALDHQQRNQTRLDQAASDLAIKRAQAATEAEIKVNQAQVENLVKISEAETKNQLAKENGSSESNS